MKLMNISCPHCGHQFEDMIDNVIGWGDLSGVPCKNCGAQNTVVACHAPQVRTPNNSVSFLDGYRDDGGAVALGYEKWKLERAAERARLVEGNFAKEREIKKERAAMEPKA